MNRKLFVTLLLGACLVWVGASSAAGQAPVENPLPAEEASPDATVGSQLTYQGWYTEAGIPVNGRRDMVFRVHTNNTCTAAVGSDISKPGVTIEDGVFEVLLDVRPQDFNGQALWLKVTVGGVDLGCLPLLPTPYAFSLRPGAEIADGDTSVQLNRSWSSSGGVSSKAAVYGKASGLQTLKYGVFGETTNGDAVFGRSESGFGVRGFAAASTGSTTGVGGYSNSTAGVGVYGEATASSGAAYGVYGVSNSPGGAGVYALGNGEQDPDLILGGKSDANDNGVIWSDPRFTGSDVFIRSHDDVGIHLNRDGETDPAKLGEFHIYNGQAQSILRVQENGTLRVNVLQIVGGSDLSERFDVSSARGEIKPGMAVCIDSAHPGQLVVCEKAYDRKVAGIVSGAGGIAPGMVMGQEGSPADGAHPVTLTGRVYALADASMGPIQPGDLLTTSAKPGHVMRVTDYAQAVGAIIGKAMTSLSQGTGQILVLVGLQ